MANPGSVTNMSVAQGAVVYYDPSAGYGMTGGQTGLYLSRATTRSSQFTGRAISRYLLLLMDNAGE